MSVSDTDVSEVSWTDNGTFNLSEGNTPQTDTSDGMYSSFQVFQLLKGVLAKNLKGNFIVI